MKAIEAINKDREELVDFIIQKMETEGINWKKGWDPSVLQAQNPISNVKYKGLNILRILKASAENEYKDPRWMTFKQAQENGYKLKKGSNSILCEKWIYQKKEKVMNENGEEEYKIVDLRKPIPSYFRIFNASQFENVEPFKLKTMEENEILKIANNFIKSSKVPIKEIATQEAFYTPANDEIVIPLKESFKNQDEFLSTLLHEMVHSTVKELDRELPGEFGTPSYAKEELVAELGSVFLQSKLDIQLNEEHLENHSAYLKSWIDVLKKDKTEFFKAVTKAEKASDLLYERYLEVEKKLEIDNKENDKSLEDENNNNSWNNWKKDKSDDLER